MIQADHPLTVTRRCALLDVARSTVYYQPTGVSAEDLALMRLLDEIHLERWVDNVFVERLWRSVKYEDVYLHAYETPAALAHPLFSVLQRGDGVIVHLVGGRRMWCTSTQPASARRLETRWRFHLSLSRFRGPLLTTPSEVPESPSFHGPPRGNVYPATTGCEGRSRSTKPTCTSSRSGSTDGRRAQTGSTRVWTHGVRRATRLG